MEVSSKTPAVVTGGASGLGEATARALAAKGAHRHGQGVGRVALSLGVLKAICIPFEVLELQRVRQGVGQHHGFVF